MTKELTDWHRENRSLPTNKSREFRSSILGRDCVCDPIRIVVLPLFWASFILRHFLPFSLAYPSVSSCCQFENQSLVMAAAATLDLMICADSYWAPFAGQTINWHHQRQTILINLKKRRKKGHKGVRPIITGCQFIRWFAYVPVGRPICCTAWIPIESNKMMEDGPAVEILPYVLLYYTSCCRPPRS